MFRENLNLIIRRQDLNEAQMSEMITDIFSGEITDAQIAGFMAALATKGETAGELAGAARAMRRRAHRIQTTASTVVDTCGTGGDGSDTFNISTATAFVVSGCGVTVAKHGNRSISSRCGSADVLEALGVDLEVAPEIVEEAIGEIGIGFLFAPLYHGAMRHAANARKQLGIRSIFNMLGPLTNPAGANCQIIGVYAPELTEMFADALKSLGARRAMVVHGHDGLDEITVCDATRISELAGGRVRTYDFTPEQAGIAIAGKEQLKGGGPEENAGIIRRILNGEKGPRRDIVLLNAAAALMSVDMAGSMTEGVRKAAESIDSGAAMDKLNALVEFTNDV